MINSFMESDIPMEIVEVGNEPVEVVTDCLSVSLILRNIFQHFSSRELLKLSLVNKRWRYEAGRFLRDRDTVTAVVNKKRKCQDLVAFASDLRRTKEITRVLAASGLTIHLGGLECNHGDGQQSSELDQACDDILDQLTWKHFAIKFDWEWTKELKTCPGFLLTKKILQKRGHVLEELLLELPGERGDTIQQVIEGCCKTFSSLQVLKVKLPSFRNGGYTQLIRSLVSHSPNLKVLDTSGRVNLRGNLLEGSSAVHVSRYPFSPFGNEIPEGIIGRLRLTGMELYRYDQDFDVNRFNRITSGLLEASSLML